MVEGTNALAQRLLSRKTINSMGGTLNEAAAAPATGGFGAKMLAKFGWKEGEGLGKNGDGRRDHIRVTKRAEGLGLGASDKPPSEWAPPPGSRAALSKAADSDSESEDEEEAKVRQRIGGSGVIPGLSDEELFSLCGGARLGMRARATQGGKLKRMEEADRALAEKRGQAAVASAASPSEVPTSKRQRTEPAASDSSATADTSVDAAAAARKAAKKAAKKAEAKAARKAEKKAQKKAQMQAETKEPQKEKKKEKKKKKGQMADGH